MARSDIGWGELVGMVVGVVVGGAVGASIVFMAVYLVVAPALTGERPGEFIPFVYGMIASPLGLVFGSVAGAALMRGLVSRYKPAP